MRQLQNMTWTEVQEVDPSRTVILMVLGPMEQHGPHLPLGTDLMVAEHMARQMVTTVEEQGWEVLWAPPISYVPAVLSRSYPGSISIRKRTFQAYLSEVLAGFAENGFQHQLLVSTHIDPPFLRSTQEACREVNRRYHARAIHGYERFPLEDLLAGKCPTLFGYRKEGDVHAGVLETSALLTAAPEAVRRPLAERLPPQPAHFTELQHLDSFRSWGNGLGYTGYPGLARKEYGEIWFRRYGRRFAEIVRRWLDGEEVFEELAIDQLVLGS